MLSIFVIFYTLMAVHDAAIATAALQLAFALIGATIGAYHLGHRGDKDDE